METMPPVSTRFAQMNPAARTRLLMAGAIAGALLAIGITVLLTTAISDDDKPSGPPPLPARVKAAFEAPAGTCLNWEKADATDMRRIACERPHLFEITEVRDLTAKFPKGAKSPSVDKWIELANSECAKGAKSYLGEGLDPHGKLKLSLLRPSEQAWKAGRREVRCGVQWTAPGGELQLIKGPAAKFSQSDVWPRGTCLGIENKTVGDPIDCANPHSYEMLAVLNLRDKFGKAYPSERDQKAWLDTKCARVAKAYTGGLNLEKKKLILTWDTRKKASWAAGSYLVNCKVAAVLDDESGLAPITGGIAKKEPPPTTTKSKPKAG